MVRGSGGPQELQEDPSSSRSWDKKPDLSVAEELFDEEGGRSAKSAGGIGGVELVLSSSRLDRQTASQPHLNSLELAAHDPLLVGRREASRGDGEEDAANMVSPRFRYVKDIDTSDFPGGVRVGDIVMTYRSEHFLADAQATNDKRIAKK